jgi:hypothetical protein
VERLRGSRPLVRSVPAIVRRALVVAAAVAGLRALRYFARKLLSSSDLEQEQHYDVAQRPGEEWKYTPIRRLFVFLEQSVDEGLRWAGFEPRDDSGARYRRRSRRG